MSRSKSTGLLLKSRHAAKQKRPRGGRRCVSVLSHAAPRCSSQGAQTLFTQPRHPVPSQKQTAAPGDCSHELLGSCWDPRSWPRLLVPCEPSLQAPNEAAGLEPRAREDFANQGTQLGISRPQQPLPPSSIVPRRSTFPTALLRCQDSCPLQDSHPGATPTTAPGLERDEPG